MNKLILLTFFLVSGITQALAVNGDDIFSQFVEVPVAGNVNYIIPAGYDLYVEKAQVFVEQGLVSLEVKDGTDTIYKGSFPEGDNFAEYNLVFRNNVEVINIGNKDFSALYQGYLFQEKSFITTGEEESSINKPVFNKETLIEIYEYEAIIMVIIVFFTFLARLLGLRPPPKGFMKK